MNRLKGFALGASLLFVSTSAMALRTPESGPVRSRPAGSVIDVILNRDGVRGQQSIDQRSKEQGKREKAWRKEAKEREKEMREGQREREKDFREATREREKDLREAARERAKNARQRRRD